MMRVFSILYHFGCALAGCAGLLVLLSPFILLFTVGLLFLFGKGHVAKRFFKKFSMYANNHRGNEYASPSRMFDERMISNVSRHDYQTSNNLSFTKDTSISRSGDPLVNPMSGLQMANRSFDVSGNPYGSSCNR